MRWFLGICFGLSILIATMAQAGDPLSGKVARIVAFEDGGTLDASHDWRIQFVDTAIIHHDICMPTAVGRTGLRVGGPVDPDVLGPRPAIHCFAIPQSSMMIGAVFATMDRLEHDAATGRVVMFADDRVVMIAQVLA